MWIGGAPTRLEQSGEPGTRFQDWVFELALRSWDSLRVRWRAGGESGSPQCTSTTGRRSRGELDRLDDRRAARHEQDVLAHPAGVRPDGRFHADRVGARVDPVDRERLI